MQIRLMRSQEGKITYTQAIGFIFHALEKGLQDLGKQYS